MIAVTCPMTTMEPVVRTIASIEFLRISRSRGTLGDRRFLWRGGWVRVSGGKLRNDKNYGAHDAGE